ncbi:MAG: SDR family NAD(P)-dependent oxidoreductase [Congregibacter sp.]
MTDEQTRTGQDYRAALLRARDTIADLMQQNAALKTRDTVGIIGMACRFPGDASDLNAYWRLLDEGTDGISDVGDERWPTARYLSHDRDVPGKMYTCKAGLLSGPIDRFDARFFGVSQKEAGSLDPQQRLLMELSWQALEDAGIPPGELEGTRTGVFVGLSGDDYARMHRHSGDPDNVDAYSLTGTTMSTASGRLAYHYGLRGPCFTLDTACSSSLVALHLAVKSIRDGECERALVGASNLILMPENHIAFCKMGALSPDGQCRTFDAGANGYVRSEGVGFIVLQKLDEARSQGRRIHGVVSGTAINQDGRTAGLSAPNGNAQRDVIQAALADARLNLGDIDYVEAHGTGTVLGDPIELEALASVPGRGDGEALLVGSAKSNIGHMEPVAGLGGLIKILLALQHERIPANLHFTHPNPNFNWQSGAVRVVDTTTPWPRTPGRPRRAGLSAFGFSGTNAHVILAEPPAEEVQGQSEANEGQPTHLLRLSARSTGSLRALASRYQEFLSETPHSAGDICASALAHRTRFKVQVAVAGTSPRELAERLGRFLESGTNAPATGTGGDPREAAWLFTGQGAQYPGMGRDLYASDAIFRVAIDQCALILDSLGETKLTDILFSDDTDRIHHTAHTQPALFALEYALAQRWLAWGFRPAVVLGHSIGEYVAACVAGVLSLEDALTLVSLRGRLMGALPAGGAMAAVSAGQAELREVISAVIGADEIDIAASNAPRETVISGPSAAVDNCVAACEKQGLRCSSLKVSHAFHSRMMASILPEFAAAVECVQMHPARMPIILNTTGQLAPGGRVAADYWVRQIVSTVRFQACVETLVDMLAETNIGCCLELGPHPILSAILNANLSAVPSADPDNAASENFRESLPVVYSLRRDRSARSCLGRAHEQLVSLSVEPEWGDRYPNYRFVDLPLYAFDGERYWHDAGYRSALSTAGARESTPASAPSVALSLLDVEWVREDHNPCDGVGPWLLLGDDNPALSLSLKRFGLTTVNAPGWERLPEAALSDTTTTIVCVEHLLLDVAALPERLRYVADLVAAISTRSASGCVWIVGSGSSPEGPSALDLYRGSLSSLLLDYPMVRGGVIELDTRAPEAVVSLLNHRSDSTWLRLNASGISVARLVERDWQEAVKHVRIPQCALITGGLGGIGLALARELAAGGTRRLVLLGRSAPSTEAQETLADLRERGVLVETVACDIASPDASEVLQHYFAQLPQCMVVHAAGVMPSDPGRDYVSALAAKVGGAVNLLTALRGFDAIDLVLLGSISAVLGTPGLSAYSAANAALSAVARWYRQQGGTASCVNWGPWEEGGIMQAGHRSQTDRSGFFAVSSPIALEAVLQLESRHPDVPDYPCIASADWHRVAESFALRRRLDLLSSITQKTPEHATSARDSELGSPAADVPEALATLKALSQAEREPAIVRHLSRCLIQALGLTEDEIPGIDRGFFDLGMDSLKALEFRESIEVQFGLRLDAADVFDYPTLETLSNYLLEGLALSEAKSVDSLPRPGLHSSGTAFDSPASTVAVSTEVENGIAELTEDELARLIDDEFDSTLAEDAQ